MDPLEVLRQSEQCRGEAQLSLVAEVMAALKAMAEAEKALYAARRHYIGAFKRATARRWTAKELRNAGFPTPEGFRPEEAYGCPPSEVFRRDVVPVAAEAEEQAE